MLASAPPAWVLTATAARSSLRYTEKHAKATWSEAVRDLGLVKEVLRDYKLELSEELKLFGALLSEKNWDEALKVAGRHKGLALGTVRRWPSHLRAVAPRPAPLARTRTRGSSHRVRRLARVLVAPGQAVPLRRGARRRGKPHCSGLEPRVVCRRARLSRQ